MVSRSRALSQLEAADVYIRIRDDLRLVTIGLGGLREINDYDLDFWDNQNSSHRITNVRSFLLLLKPPSSFSLTFPPALRENVWYLRSTRFGKAGRAPHSSHRLLEENQTSWSRLVWLLCWKAIRARTRTVSNRWCRCVLARILIKFQWLILCLTLFRHRCPAAHQ